LLPNHLITHAPQGPYFKNDYYRNGGYITVNNKVGSTIDFYNVQYYNQGSTLYDTYDGLFISSGGWSTGTSVKEIAAKGIPMNKIVVGKPVTPSDASNTGWMDMTALGDAATRAYKELNWYGGIMYWQLVSDVGGKSI